jgi:hypothetical protein
MFQSEDDAWAFLLQCCQDYVGTLPTAARQATAPAINTAFRVVRPASAPVATDAPTLPLKGAC